MLSRSTLSFLEAMDEARGLQGSFTEQELHLATALMLREGTWSSTLLAIPSSAPCWQTPLLALPLTPSPCLALLPGAPKAPMGCPPPLGIVW